MNSTAKRILLVYCFLMLGIGCERVLPAIQPSTSTRQNYSEIPTIAMLEGTNWRLQAVNKDMVSRGSLSFGGAGRFSAYFCNGISGEYSIDNGYFNAHHLFSTLALCTGGSRFANEPDVMTLEGAFDTLASSSAIRFSYDIFGRRTLLFSDTITTLTFRELRATPRPVANRQDTKAATEYAVAYVAKLGTLPLYEPRFFTDVLYRSAHIKKIFDSNHIPHYESFPRNVPGNIFPSTTFEFKPHSARLTFEDGYEIAGTLFVQTSDGKTVATYPVTTTGRTTVEGIPQSAYATTTYTESGLFSFTLPYTHFLRLEPPNDVRYWAAPLKGTLFLNPNHRVAFGNYEGVSGGALRTIAIVSVTKNSSSTSCTGFKDLPISPTSIETVSLNHKIFSVALLNQTDNDYTTKTAVYRRLVRGTCFEITASRFIVKNYPLNKELDTILTNGLKEMVESFKIL